MSIQLDFSKYYTYQELTDALHDLNQAYPEISKLYSIGQSHEGRELWMMELTNPATGAAAAKPAYYIDGNHHAGEVTGSMVALYTIYHLLTEFASDASVRRLLDSYTFYVLPRVSPDGAETYLTTAETLRSAPRAYPFAEPKPGLHPADINGDGEILLMRVKAPNGDWCVSADDPRQMIKRRPDEEGGEYYRLYTEGMIEEFDGLAVTAAPHKWGIDLNRNYPCEWGIESRQPGAGPYPLSEPETRAVANFVLAHPNIASASTLHTTGGVILRPPGTRPESKAAKRDVAALTAIGEMATEETGYPCVNIFDGFLQDTVNFSSGAYDDWLYQHLGIPAYTVELWDLANRSGIEGLWPRKHKTEKEQSQDFAKLLAWNDKELNGEGFVPWTPFTHPQLGPVDIGGWKGKFVVQNCPAKFLEQECIKVTKFHYRHARTMPKLFIERLRSEKVDHETWRVSVVVGNSGYLPTFLTQVAVDQKTAKPVTAELNLPEAVQIVVGKAKVEVGHLEGRAGRSGAFHNGSFRAGRDLPSEKKVEWLIKATAGQELTVKVASEKAGSLEAKITLK